jgi:hypothetical protein
MREQTPHGKRIQQKIQRDIARHDGMRAMQGFHGGHLGQGPPPGLYGGYPAYGAPPPPQSQFGPGGYAPQHHVSLGPQHTPSAMMGGAGDYGRAFSMPQQGVNGHQPGSAGGSPSQPFATTFPTGAGPALFGPPLGVEYAPSPFAPFH